MIKELIDLDYNKLRPLRSWNTEITSYEKYLNDRYTNWKQSVSVGQSPNEYAKPTAVQLELTSRCNQRCLTCYNRSGANETFTHGSELSVKEWQDVAHQLCELGVFQVIVSGGEPTILGDDLFRIMDIFHEAGARFLLITNGMLLDRRRVERLARYGYHYLQISMDGATPELHDYVRQAAGSWHRAVHGAMLAREAGIPLVIAHTVTKTTVSTLPDMVDLAFLLGAERIILGIFMYSGRAILNESELSLSKEETSKYYSIFEQKSRQYHATQLMEVYDSLDEAVSFRLQIMLPNNVMLIRPNGDVKVDCALPFTIGNVRSQPLVDIWNQQGKSIHTNPRLHEYVKQIRSEEDIKRLRPRPYVDPDIRLELI